MKRHKNTLTIFLTSKNIADLLLFLWQLYVGFDYSLSGKNKVLHSYSKQTVRFSLIGESGIVFYCFKFNSYKCHTFFKICVKIKSKNQNVKIHL